MKHNQTRGALSSKGRVEGCLSQYMMFISIPILIGKFSPGTQDVDALHALLKLGQPCTMTDLVKDPDYCHLIKANSQKLPIPEKY